MVMMTTDGDLGEEKHKLSRLVFNATEMNGKVREWKAINDAVRNILKLYRSRVVENQETRLALAISPLLADSPWDLGYAQLQAVVLNFSANANPSKPTPVRIDLTDARKAQAALDSRVKNSRTVPVGPTTEKIPTATKHMNLNPPTTNNTGKPNSVPRSEAQNVPVRVGPVRTMLRVQIPPFDIQRRTGQVPAKPQPVDTDAEKLIVSPATTDQMDVDDTPPGIPATGRDLNPFSHRPPQGSGGRAEMSMVLPVLKNCEARGRLQATHGKLKLVPDSSGSEEEDFDREQFGNRHRTKTVAKPKDVQGDANIRAAIPCEQCKKSGVEFECFTLINLPGKPMRRACTRCRKKKKGCSFNSGFTQAKKNAEPSSNTVINSGVNLRGGHPSDLTQAKKNAESSSNTVTNSDVNMRGKPPSDHANQGSSQLGDVRVTRVENMVNVLQGQFKTLQDKVVVMDTRIEDIFEGTRSVARVMKRFETRFETRSEQTNRVIEKLVERIEQL